VYRRAVEAKPTGFSENPIGAMASAVDKLGRAAGHVFATKQLEGQDGLANAEGKLKAAIAKMRAEPGSLEAKQRALVAGLELLKQMETLAPNDPRRLSVSKFLVGLANQLGADGIPFRQNIQGLDVNGLLRLAAQTMSRFGSPQDMQAAFTLESTLKAALPTSSAQALAMRDELMQRLGLSQHARSVLTSGWAVREAAAGEVPQLDVSSRTMVLDAAKQNPSLGIMARAYWQDQMLRSPADKDGFMEAFRKIATQSSFAVLSRKYRDVRDHARREMQQSRVGVLGAGGASSAPARTEESADMFASLATFTRGDSQAELPPELASALGRFYLPV
jgi:hypothetical protein